jgi:hypothetical protein
MGNAVLVVYMGITSCTTGRVEDEAEEISVGDRR